MEDENKHFQIPLNKIVFKQTSVKSGKIEEDGKNLENFRKVVAVLRKGREEERSKGKRRGDRNVREKGSEVKKKNKCAVKKKKKKRKGQKKSARTDESVMTDERESTNDITLPALNITQNDTINDTLQKVKLRSRSVLKRAKFHRFIKPKHQESSDSIFNRKRRSILDRVNITHQNNQGVEPSSATIKLPLLNQTPKLFQLNIEMKSTLKNKAHNNDSILLDSLHKDIKELLEEVKKEPFEPEESSHKSSTPQVRTEEAFHFSEANDLHLDNEEKKRMLRNEFKMQNRTKPDDLDFETPDFSEYSKPTISRESNFGYDLFSDEYKEHSQKNIPTMKLKDPFKKTGGIKINKIEHYFKLKKEIFSSPAAKPNPTRHGSGLKKPAQDPSEPKAAPSKPQPCAKPKLKPKSPANAQIEDLIKHKPWLKDFPLKKMKLENLQKYFVVTESERDLTEEDKKKRDLEVEFINKEVMANKDMMRENKTDQQLFNDFRYLGKYGQYLYQRVKDRNHYQRLDIYGEDETNLTKIKLKKCYLKKVRIWHPDNLKKHKYCFANEESACKLISNIFQLIDDSYKTLLNKFIN
ncbi:unnamed protein product [Moneuplotes crassus]|uniref:J domain-containing protein n=1 Tax=Euplotes crassus TaxID=5936 RepID=A0AAD1Y6I6_EUPCR|nr:unnamed protein product [Moneuplotes crassus]